MKITLRSIYKTLLLTGLLFASANGQTTISWEGNATAMRGRNNQQFTFNCPAGGTLSGSIWGTDIYTDDTSICTAAVHSRRITPQGGGSVTIEIRPGAASYTSSSRNGVTSRDYGGWSGSYVIVGSTTPPIETKAEKIDWGKTATGYRGQNSQRYAFVCPAGGTLSGSIWGTDLYTDDSSICTAAVHAGFLDARSGGTIAIEIRPGASAYAASVRNGVTTKAYGSWSGSFAVVKVKTPTADPNAKTIGWATTATDLRGRNGQRFSFFCPPGGSVSGAIWGTDVYTDDSSICTAAVHRGLITAASGGSVTLEVRPGAGGYTASTRNGVTSRAYGGWSGSYSVY